MAEITKSTMQNGSYGIYAPGPNSGAKLVTIWFCGAWKVRRNASGEELCGAPWMKQQHAENHIGNTSQPCVHRTKAEALACAKAKGNA